MIVPVLIWSCAESSLPHLLSFLALSRDAASCWPKLEKKAVWLFGVFYCLVGGFCFGVVFGGGVCGFLFVCKYSVLLCLWSLYPFALGTVAGIMKVVNAVSDAYCLSKTQSSVELWDSLQWGNAAVLPSAAQGLFWHQKRSVGRQMSGCLTS